MANTRRRWTEEEDKILVQAIKANPHNKAEAFRQASTEMDRDEKSCANRWYKQLSNEYSKHYVGSLFTMIGYYSRLDNRTVNRKDVHITPIESSETLWSKIKRLFGIK